MRPPSKLIIFLLITTLSWCRADRPQNFPSSSQLNGLLGIEEATLNLLNHPFSHSWGNSSGTFSLFQKSLIPRYLHTFLQALKSNFTNDRSQNEQFISQILFEEVSNDDCKGHVLEWLMRVLSLTDGETSLWGDKDKWVLQIADAWGKWPEGILTGHVNSYGDFHECIEIEERGLKIYNKLLPDISDSFDGRYCTSHLVVWNPLTLSSTAEVKGNSEMQKELTRLAREIGIDEVVGFQELLRRILTQLPSTVMMLPTWATCTPNSCSQRDVNVMLVNAFEFVYKLLDRFPPELPIKIYPWTTSCVDRKKPDLDAGSISVIVLLAVIIGLCLSAGVVDYFLNHGVEKPPRRGLGYHYFMAFSMYTNTKKWLSTRKGAEDFGCLHGIRFFSTAWVVFAHTYAVTATAPIWNNVDIKRLYTDITTLSAINGTFSVDTFFVMSGFLATYGIFKVLDKTKGKLNVFMFYVHRYIRLTPTYAILVGIGATLTVYMGNGPMWYKIIQADEHCRKYWWTNLLYINNLIHTKEMCNGESWYLSNDMQFYILSPFIVYPMWQWEIFGLVALVIYTILSIAAPILVVHYTGAPPAIAVTGRINLTNYGEIYVRPWSRIQTFLVGVWIGYILYKTKGQKIRLPKYIAALGWLASTGTALAVLFGIQPWFSPDKDIPEIPGLIYAGLSRFSWACVVSWVIFACIKGYGGLVNTFLSWSVFMPLGRLCFCVYLVSLHLQNIFHFGMPTPMRYDRYTMINLSFAHMLMSYLIGFFATILFETPFMVLQKLIFEGPPKPRAAPVSAAPTSTTPVIEEKIISTPYGNGGNSMLEDTAILKSKGEHQN